MANYPIVYTSEVDSAVAGIDRLTAALTALDAVADRVGPKVKNLARGADKAMVAAAVAAQKLQTNLGTLQAGAGQAASAVGKVASSSKAAATQTAAAGTAVSSLGRRMGSAAGSATTLGTAVTGAGTAAQGAAAGLTAAGNAAKGIKAPTNSAATALDGFVTKAIALQAARSVFTTLVDEANRLEQYWKKIAEEASTFRDELKELASLTGHKGPSNEVTGNALDLALAARFKEPGKAGDFLKEYENVGPAVRERGHYKPSEAGKTPEQLEKEILTEAARTGHRLGIEGKPMAQLAGQAGLMHTFGSKQEAMQQIGGAIEGIQQGKLDYTEGVKNLAAASANLQDPEAAAAEDAVPGSTGSLAETGVYLGASSFGTTNAARAAHMMTQTSRALNPSAAYRKGLAAKSLAEAGVGRDSGLTDQDKLIRLDEFLDAQGVRDKKSWLEEHGIGTDAQRQTLVRQFKQTDVLKGRLAQLRGGAKANAAGTRAIAQNDEFFATDISSQKAGVDTAAAVQKIVEGQQVSEQYEAAKSAADLRIKQNRPGQYFNRALNAIKSGLSPVEQLLTGVDSYAAAAESDPDYGAHAVLRKEAARVGADISEHLPGLQSKSLQSRGRAFTAAANKVRAAGGDPYGSRAVEAEAQRGVDANRAVPAQRQGVGAGVGPQASLGGPTGLNGALAATAMGATQGGFDGTVQKEQLRLLGSIDRKLGEAGGGGTSWGPLPVDGGDFGPLRS